ncbi:MAG: DUF6701 domain-containing protein [Pseudomonadota bacterium]
MKRQYCWPVFFALLLLCSRAVAATCTSIASGNWNNNATWSCNKTPGAGDTVVIKNPYTVNLNGDRSAASLTIDAGGTLVDGGNNLTVSGNVVINGTYDGTGNDGKLIMTGNGSTLSGTGTVKDIGRIQVDANVTIPAGSNLNLTLKSEIRVGNNAAATLTIDGTVTGTAQTNGNRIIRLDNNNASSVVINGVINAPNSFVEIQQGGAVTNNGTVTLQYLDGNGDTNTTWTQGANSSLTLSQPTQGWNGTFNASATGNTVTFNGTAVPFNPATYYNIDGTGVTCPHPAGITVLGTSPCGGGGGGGGGGCNSLLPPMPAGGNVVASGSTTTIGAGTNVNGTAVTGTGNSILSPGSTTTWSAAGAALPAPPSPIPTSTVRTTVGAGGLAAGSYGDVRVTTGTGVFTGGSYFMNELYVAPGATAQLAPGDYYVNKLTVGSSITKTGGTLTLSGNGLVRIFVKTNAKGDAALYGGSSGIWDGSLINVGGNPGNLQILLYETTTYFEIGNNAQLTGFVIQPVYGGTAGAKAIDVHDNAIITGGLYTAGLLNIKNNVTFNYTPAVASAISTMSTCSGPHHFEIQHADGQGMTCAATTLTIRACADAACTTPYTTGASGTLSATGTPTVNWDGTTGGASGAGFVIASGSSSVTKNMQVAAAGSVVLDVASATPAPSGATTCNFGNPACKFTANLAGFIFSDTPTGGSYGIPSQVSGVAASGLYLRAVQASTTNPAVCTPAIIGQTAAVNMGYTCDDPATCSAGSLAIINTIAVAPTGTPVSLAFDANGAAPISARYDDVGQIRLTASTTVTPFGGATPVTLNGNSSAYVVRPHHFDLSAIKCTTADAANCGAGALAMPTPGDNPAAADAAGPSFIAAGTPFSVTVTARNALNGATPNFGKEVVPEGVALTPTLVAPAGGNNPALGGSFGAFSNGVATGTNFTWGEAGIVTLAPGIADGSYLGAGNTTGTASANVGRFYPHHFTLSGASIANRADLICTPASIFTYAGEKFRAAFTLTAQNAVNATTANYNGAFAKFDGAVPANYGFGAIDLAAPTPSLNLDIAGASSSGNWAAGVGTLNADLGLTRAAAPDGPYESFNLGMDPVDADGVKLASYDLDVNNDTVADHGLVGASKIRYGRLKLSHAHGSEVLDLPIGIQAQYWNGTVFVTNTDDNCTTLAPANITLGNYQGGITATNMGTGHVSFAGPFAVGIGNLKLTRPSPAPTGKGSVDVTVDLVTEGKTYLQGAWTGTSYNENPSARATFGVFKNPNEFIYLREDF